MGRDGRDDWGGLPPLDDEGDYPGTLGGADETGDPADDAWGAADGGADDPASWATKTLPPGYTPSPVQVLPPRVGGPGRRRRTIVIAGISAVLLVAVVAGTIFAVARGRGGGASKPADACGTASACAVARQYLKAYSGGDYEAMYATVSQASQRRFSDQAILRGRKDAHDYIVGRTGDILDQARIFSVADTPGPAKVSGTTTATVPVHLTYQSARVGTINDDIVIPLVLEGKDWRVQWSPGLIFSKLDDPQGDPTYARAVRLFDETGRRGTIFDRDGNPLAKDDQVFRIWVNPPEVKDEATLLRVLSAKLAMTPEQIKARYGPGNTVRLLTAQQFQPIQNDINPIPGVIVVTQTGRAYAYGSVTAPITGYASSVQPEDLKNDKDHYYEDGDLVGHMGVEAWAEKQLRPVKGGKLAIVRRNADGSPSDDVVTLLGQRDGHDGADVHTTINLADQQAAMLSQSKRDGHGGGSFAVDPGTGEVLAMSNYPTYDPNDFSLGFQPGISALSQLDSPLINRAVADGQPTGSVFKVFTLAAGLEHGISPSQVFTCTGSFQVPGQDKPSPDDNPNGHGALTAPGALGPSCDVVYWNVAVTLNGKDPHFLPDMGKAFGYGSAPDIVGLPSGEISAGTIPDPEWMKANGKGTWAPVDATNLAIGQGFFLATPAQVALAGAAIANDGVRMQPRLVSSITTADGQTVSTFPAKQLGTLPVSADNLKIIQAALLDAFKAGGTAAGDFNINSPYLVGGKTGTSESGQAHPHSWFMGYAPARGVSDTTTKATISVGSLVEFSDFGERYALPVTRDIIRAHLKG